MNRLRQLCAVAVLVLVLAPSTPAGDIHCGAVVPPPEAPASVTTGIEMASIDPLTEFTLSILQSLLSLF